MTDSQINILSWNRFTTRRFTVAPELLGLSHEFSFKNGQVKIELPSADNLPKEVTDESIMKSRDSKVTIKSYRLKDGHKIPTEVLINSVDVQVCLNETIALPEEVLTRPPNPVDLLSKEQRNRLDQIRNSHTDFAHEAFDRWIRILRWKSNNGSIARPEIQGFESGWGTYLLNGATKQRFWSSPLIISVYLDSPITLPIWHDVEATIKRGQEPPVYIDSMFDGIEQLKVGNLQQSVVYLAVACEAFMRTKVIQNLPQGLTTALVKYIDEANIRQVQERFFKDTLNDEQTKLLESINSRLHQLFDARNTILHSGHKEDLTSADCEQYIQATKKLIAI
jgi:hypothetical protein